MKIKYKHTNIIAVDWERLSLFYRNVFGMKKVPPERNLKGEWVDKLTGIKGAHITGEHLELPGYGDNPPTLEIFSYNEINSDNPKLINGAGLAHLAFEVDDIEPVLLKIKEEGGEQLGNVVTVQYPENVTASFVYAKDVEDNIIELQSFSPTIACREKK